MTPRYNSDWLCISCGYVLGEVMGGELYPSIPAKHTHTSGPNLVVECPECGSKKTWYTSDPVVRAIYQLVGAMTDVAAKRMVRSIAEEIRK